LDETVIRVDNERHWLYAAVGPSTNEILRIRLFQARTTQVTLLSLREPPEQQQVKQATFFINGATHLTSVLVWPGLDVRYEKHGNRNSAERVFIDLN
jgi:transposase-like protein